MKKMYVCLSICFSFFTVCALAQDASYTLPEVVVAPEPGLLQKPDSESPALGISRTEFNYEELNILRPASGADALKYAPGIHEETRGRKYKQFYSFRGQIYPYPDYAFDGVWQRDNRELIYVYPGFWIERVDIVRSSSTLFYGLADVVGVIDLKSRRPPPEAAERFCTELGFEAGTFGTYRAYGITQRGERSGTYGNIGAQHYSTDGPSGRNASERFTSAFGSFRIAPDSGTSVEGSAFIVHGMRELQTPDPDGPAGASLKNRTEKYDPVTALYMSLRGTHTHSARNASDWKVFMSDRRAVYHLEVKDPSRPPFADAEEREDDYEFGGQFVHAVEIFPDNTLRAGLTAHRWVAPNGKQSYVGFRQDVASYALVLADEQRIGRWTFDAGMRYARSYMFNYSGHAFDVEGRSTNLQPVKDEWEKPVLAGTFGVTFDIDEQNRLYSYLGAGQRRPGPGAVRPDGTTPDTEKRFTADAGWSMRLGRNTDGILKLGSFMVYRDDAVSRINETGADALGNEFYFSDNQDIRQYGLESEIRTPAFWQNRLALSGSVTWMNSDARPDGGSFKSYKEIPSLIISGGLLANVNRWDGGLYLKHVGGYESFRFAGDRQYHDLGDYWDISLVTGYRLGTERTTRVYAAVENMLDERYSTVVGWSDSGIRFRTGLEASF